MRSSTITPAGDSWSSLAAVRASATSLIALCAADVSQLSGEELVDAIVCTEKGMSLLAARQAELMAELTLPFRAGDPRRLAGRLADKLAPDLDPDGSPDDARMSPFLEEAAVCLAASEVAAALRVAPVTGSVRVRDAQELCGDLSATREALAAGTIDRGKCRVIMEATSVLAADHKAWVQAAVLPMAAERSTGRLRDTVTRAVMVVDPDGTRRRHEDAVARRDLRLEPMNDGMAVLRGCLRADNAAGIFQLTDLVAQQTDHPDDPRTIGARRIDALSDIAEQLLTHGRVDLGSWAASDIEEVSDVTSASASGIALPSSPTTPPETAGSATPASPTTRRDMTGSLAPASPTMPTTPPQTAGSPGSASPTLLPDMTGSAALASPNTPPDTAAR